MNFPNKYNVSNSNTLVSFTPSIEKKTVDDVCLNTSSFLEIVQVPGLKQSIETFPFPPGTTSASKRKKRVNWTNMVKYKDTIPLFDNTDHRNNCSRHSSSNNYEQKKRLPPISSILTSVFLKKTFCCKCLFLSS